MLLNADAGAQLGRVVAGQNRDHSLRKNGAVIKRCRDMVHRGTSDLAPCIKCSLVGMKPRESGQQ